MKPTLVTDSTAEAQAALQERARAARWKRRLHTATAWVTTAVIVETLVLETLAIAALTRHIARR